MTVDSLSAALQSLQNERPDRIGEGLEYLKTHMASLPEAEFRRAVEELCSLFYVDTADRPDLQPLLDRAVAVLAGHGPRVVGQLLELMKGSDIKSHLYLARTLAPRPVRRAGHTVTLASAASIRTSTGRLKNSTT